MLSVWSGAQREGRSEVEPKKDGRRGIGRRVKGSVSSEGRWKSDFGAGAG